MNLKTLVHCILSRTQTTSETIFMNNVILLEIKNYDTVCADPILFLKYSFLASKTCISNVRKP